MTRIRVRAHVNPTESVDKVRKAIVNLFGEIPLTFNEADSEFEAELEGLFSLKQLKDHFDRERIRDSARMMLTRRVEEDTLFFNLNRQAGYANHLSIYHADKVPMGPIEVRVKGDPEAAIEYLCGKKKSE